MMSCGVAVGFGLDGERSQTQCAEESRYDNRRKRA